MSIPLRGSFTAIHHRGWEMLFFFIIRNLFCPIGFASAHVWLCLFFMREEGRLEAMEKPKRNRERERERAEGKRICFSRPSLFSSWLTHLNKVINKNESVPSVQFFTLPHFRLVFQRQSPKLPWRAITTLYQRAIPHFHTSDLFNQRGCRIVLGRYSLL